MTCFTLPSLYFLVGVGTAATISVALTINASKRFLNSSLTNKSAYFDNLLDELANKIPVKRDRLSSDQKFQNFGNGQIVISFRIGPSNKAENTAQQVHSNLNYMLENNKINNFLSGVTNDFVLQLILFIMELTILLL
ncbi:hypothetical protein F8M41_020588 [Gigaspora margarita]|uniref:Uncharacterized protein n=1 Tax=Gigaspora margarita TaxID=4874 RepID=A0A8H3WRD7_GIGMA|nr:hypothetical protein F8M41_020588 [Gigaspora margarita]